MSDPAKLQRGLSLHQAGKLIEAGEIYREILGEDPDNVDALNLMGVLLQSGGELATSITLLERAVDLAPDYAAPLVNLGNTLQLSGRLNEAVDAFQRAMGLDPKNPAAANNLASALNELGRHAEAVDACVTAISAKHDFADAYNNMGNALAGLDRLDEAEESYKSALEHNPVHATAYFNLGNALAKQDNLDDAYDAYRRAVALDQGNAEKHYNYANTALKLGHFAEALDSFEAALEIDDEYLDAYCNMGSALQSLGRLDDAVAAYETALKMSAGEGEDSSIDLHWNLSLSLLQKGDYARGFKEYEWRWRTPTFAEFRREWEKPEWDGAALSGETVLVHAEQGFGDGIQFCRFVGAVAEKGGRVVLECRAPLTRLMTTLAGVETCFDLGQAVPEHDLQIPLMSLPRVLGTTLETLPADVPYLAVPDGAVADPRITEAQGLKVGIVWAGSPTRRDNIQRSATLGHFAPLLGTPGVSFFSLQVGPFEADLKDLDPALRVIDLAPGLNDFGDTAACIQALDLVISVDTGVLHLACALGKPAWGLMSRPTGFFWMTDGEESPWYPTVRLCRQPTPGDWDAVFAAAGQALAAMAKPGA